MDFNDEQIEYAVQNTEVLRSPKQMLSTFGTTNIYYFLLTEPSYKELIEGEEETVIREGRVVTQQPRVVTPSYLINLEGFSDHARRYIELLIKDYGPSVPGLFYGYKNEPRQTNIVSSDIVSVVQKLNEQIDKEGKLLTAIIRGVDELWDVSLLKFIFEITSNSLGNNIYEMGSRGLLDTDQSGVPYDARLSIEHLFDLVRKGDLEPSALKLELDRWGIFSEYQDRFFRFFRR